MSKRLLAAAAAALLFVLPAGGATAHAAGIAASPARAADVSAGRALERIRIAVGYRSLARLRLGIAIVEGSDQAGEPLTRLIGAEGLNLRSGSEFGQDGRVAWQYDSRRQAAVPMNRRQFEKLAWPIWARSWRWLDRDSGIKASVLEAESDGKLLALRLTTREELVPATVFVDRSTWLPVRLVVPYDRGPYTASWSDYRRVLGFLLPFRTVSNYRGESVSLVRSVRPLERKEAALRPPPLPRDHSFDDRAPAFVPVRRGTPVAPGDPGHAYVRPEVDGREIGPFLFDSGADGMMIDTRLADALGMPIIGSANSIGADGRPRPGTYRRGKSFRLGRLTIVDPVYLAVDLSANNAPPGEKRAGVIGYDLFARALVEFHGTGDRIAICDPATYRLRAGKWRPLEHLDATPAVRTRLEGDKTGLFQVDTGSAATVDFYPEFSRRERLLEGRATTLHTSQGAGGSFEIQVGRLSLFELAGRKFRDIEVAFRMQGFGRDGGAGVIGRELLAGFTTIFDYPGHRIAFAPIDARAGGCGK
jgi:hypothetical protein